MSCLRTEELIHGYLRGELDPLDRLGHELLGDIRSKQRRVARVCKYGPTWAMRNQIAPTANNSLEVFPRLARLSWSRLRARAGVTSQSPWESQCIELVHQLLQRASRVEKCQGLNTHRFEDPDSQLLNHLIPTGLQIYSPAPWIRETTTQLFQWRCW